MQSDQEMEINLKLLKELEALGFSHVRAVRALYFSGNASLEDAVNWIIDHENDPDIDEMPLVAVNIEIESPQPDHNKEVDKQVHELRDRAHWRKEAKKKLEMEREKERNRAEKELHGAKQIAEDRERQRYLASRKAEKEEEKRAREKIRIKIEADKAERRRQLGVPSGNPTTVNLSKPIGGNKVNPLPVLSTTKAEHMRECLRSLKRNLMGDDARVKRAFQTLLIYVGNIIKSPNEEKYRKIRLGNPLFRDRVGSLKGGIEFLELCGFEKTEGGDFLYLPSDKVDMAVLNSADSFLRSAITNPFFGLLSK